MRWQPFDLPDAAFRARLDVLRSTFRKWDLHVAGRPTVPKGAVVLAAEEHAAAVRAAEALTRAADRAQEALAADAAARRALGIPAALDPLVTAAAASPRITRVDLFLTDAGWMASELNDDAPGGFNEAIGLPALFADDAGKGLSAAGDLPDALLRMLPEGRIGLVYATAYSEDLQVVRLLADLLEASGRETVLASPAHLAHDGDARLAGEPVAGIFRFFPLEWFRLLPNLAAWERAVTAGLPIVNPFRAALTQPKGIFARLREDDAAARRHAPETFPFDRTRALAHRPTLVLKPVFGRMGDGVVVGAATPPDTWAKVARRAAREPTRYVLQERFRPLPLEVAPGTTRTVCVGAYVVDGRFAGYYSRISEGPVVAYDAANVLTLVEGL